MNPEREYGKALGRLEEHNRWMAPVSKQSFCWHIANNWWMRRRRKKLILAALEARRIARRKCDSCKHFARDEYGDGKHFCFGRYCRVSDASRVGTCKKFTPAPMPADMQARLAEAMEGAREEGR